MDISDHAKDETQKEKEGVDVDTASMRMNKGELLINADVAEQALKIRTKWKIGPAITPR